MKKQLIFISAIFALGFWLAGFHLATPLWAGSGKSIFMSKGCIGCHNKNKGMDPKAKPAPSKQHMASLSFRKFKNCVLKGRKGTTMMAFKLSNRDLKAIFKWVKKFK